MEKWHLVFLPIFTLKKFLPLTFARPLSRLEPFRWIQRGPCLNGLLLTKAMPLKIPYFTKCRGNLNEWPPISLVHNFLLVLQPTLLKNKLHTAGRTLVLSPPARMITPRVPRVRSVILVVNIYVANRAWRNPTTATPPTPTSQPLPFTLNVSEYLGWQRERPSPYPFNCAW